MFRRPPTPPRGTMRRPPENPYMQNDTSQRPTLSQPLQDSTNRPTAPRHAFTQPPFDDDDVPVSFSMGCLLPAGSQIPKPPPSQPPNLSMARAPISRTASMSHTAVATEAIQQNKDELNYLVGLQDNEHNGISDEPPSLLHPDDSDDSVCPWEL